MSTEKPPVALGDALELFDRLQTLLPAERARELAALAHARPELHAQVLSLLGSRSVRRSRKIPDRQCARGRRHRCRARRRRPAGALSAGEANRDGRHGRGLARAPQRWTIRRRRRPQGSTDSPGAVLRSRAIRARGEDPRPALPSEHRAAPGCGDHIDRRVVSGVGVCGGRADRSMVRRAKSRHFRTPAALPPDL